MDITLESCTGAKITDSPRLCLDESADEIRPEKLNKDPIKALILCSPFVLHLPSCVGIAYRLLHTLCCRRVKIGHSLRESHTRES